MTSLFSRALFENMGTKLKFSPSFHPQTDGQSKISNSIILDLLKRYVSDHKQKWEQYLLLVEYVYTNTIHTSTGWALFEIVKGGKKVPPILHTKDKIFEANKYTENWDEVYKKVKYALEHTQVKQKKAAHQYWRPLEFKLCDWILLRFKKAILKKMRGRAHLFLKLSMRYYAHCQVLHKMWKCLSSYTRSLLWWVYTMLRGVARVCHFIRPVLVCIEWLCLSYLILFPQGHHWLEHLYAQSRTIDSFKEGGRSKNMYMSMWYTSCTSCACACAWCTSSSCAY